MVSEHNKKVSSDDSRSAKATTGPEVGPSEDRSQAGASPSEGFKDIGDSGCVRRPTLGLGNGSKNMPQAMVGAGKDTTGPAPVLESDGKNGGRGEKRAEPAMSTKGAENPPDERLDNNKKEVHNSESSSASAAPKPLLEDSWRIVMKEVDDIDNEQFKSWKEDIDTLLVFALIFPLLQAGLFSAVVTAFTIESYQWLSEDPQDTTVALLRQISQQMSNMTVTHIKPFEASSSNVRINGFWFLSLIISLVDALFGLLCKQWLREHQQPTHTRTPEEALALRWLRRKSLEIWHVPTFVAVLPMLLELALFFFFAGLLELLWTRHAIPFSIAIIVIGSAILVYVGTTIIPSIDIIRQALQVTPDFINAQKDAILTTGTLHPVNFMAMVLPMEFTCPYKSPQAWVAFEIARTISRISYLIMKCCDQMARTTVQKYFPGYFKIIPRLKVLNVTLNINHAGWPSVDLGLLRRSPGELVPQFYELQAFRWVVRELINNPSMIPHLQNTLERQPLHLLMPVVLDQWLFFPGRDWTKADIGAVLRGIEVSKLQGLQGHKTPNQYYWLREHAKKNSRIFRQLLHYHHMFISIISSKALVKNDWDCLIEAWKKLYTELGQSELSFHGQRIGVPFSFHTLDRILGNSSDPEAFGLEFFKCCTAEERWGRRNDPVLQSLVQHIFTTSTPPNRLYGSPVGTSSPFIKSRECLTMIQKIHDNRSTDEDLEFTSQDVHSWLEVTDIIRHVHDLPVSYFPPLPGYFPIPLTKLEELLWALPDEPSDCDFEFLFSYQKHWPNNMFLEEKRKFIEIFSEYINKYPDCRSLRNKHNVVTPLATHPKGLTFIGFLYMQWGALHTELEHNRSRPWVQETCTEPWMKALEYVRIANDLSPDEFKAIFTPLPDSHSESPLSNATQLQTQGDSMATEGHMGGGDGDSAVAGSNKDGVTAGTPSNQEVIEMVTLAQPAEGSGRGDVDHTSQNELGVPYREENDKNV
ncbi:hypothetical protein V5O48_014507 [Marasmius crinis-equi]|uniref:DUF6535 domain-containing protein n=1 Tax=Marasmius crinis-equi TaxID=585013 RepID=A0ABR3EXE6_9AGAR